MRTLQFALFLGLLATVAGCNGKPEPRERRTPYDKFPAGDVVIDDRHGEIVVAGIVHEYGYYGPYGWKEAEPPATGEFSVTFRKGRSGTVLKSFKLSCEEAGILRIPVPAEVIALRDEADTPQDACSLSIKGTGHTHTADVQFTDDSSRRVPSFTVTLDHLWLLPRGGAGSR
jgi:hypothetical protein